MRADYIASLLRGEEVVFERKGLLTYLEQWVMMRATMQPGGPVTPFNSIEDFVLKNGAWHTPAPLPGDLKLGTPKACFWNAYLAVRRSPRKYLYVEGYACPIVPVLHAWIVAIDEPKRAIEVTWNPVAIPCSLYYGVTFKTAYLKRTIRRKGEVCLLDSMEENYPLLTGEHSVKEAVA